MKLLPLVISHGNWSRLAMIALVFAGSISSPAQNSTPYPLGLYSNNPNGSDSNAESAFEGLYNSFNQLVGTAPKYFDYFTDQRQPVSAWPSNAGWAAWSGQNSPVKSLVPVIGLPMASTASGSASLDVQFKAFASGQYDTDLQQIVQQWQQHGFNTQYYRVGQEMNLSGSPWFAGADAGTEADWVAAFQHIAIVLRQAGAANNVTVQIIWNPGATNYDQSNTLSALYPGNGYVDLIGADIYADVYPYGSTDQYYDWDKNDGTLDTLAQFLADPVNRVHYWTYPAATQYSLDGSGGHNLSLQVLLNFAKAQGKSFAVPETGAGNAGGGHDVPDDAAFPGWLANTLAASGQTIALVNIWDSNGGGNYLFSTTDAGKPNEAAAWAKAFGVTSTGAISSSVWYTITNANSGSCVDDTGGSAANGTAIQQWQCTQSNYNQGWQFMPTDSGYYRIVSRRALGSDIDVDRQATANGSSIHLYQNNNQTNQQWLPVALGSGQYKFVGRGSGRCLDVPGASRSNGVLLQIYDCNGTGAQAFTLTIQP